MKQYDELTPDVKAKVAAKLKNELLDMIATAPELYPEFKNEINEAIRISEDASTPWFFKEILYNETEAKEKIDSIVNTKMRSSIYFDKNDGFFSGIIFI